MYKLLMMIMFALVIGHDHASANIFEKYVKNPIGAMQDIKRDLQLGVKVLDGVIPGPRLDLENQNPQCSVLLSSARAGGTSGICAAYGLEKFVPQRWFYGNKVIDIQTQCHWHDGCYAARWHGGSFSRKQCDDIFYQKLLAECKSKVGHCSGVLSHCASVAHVYYRAVQEGGRKAWSTRNPTRPSDTSVFGSPTSNPQVLSDGGRVMGSGSVLPGARGKVGKVLIEGDRTIFDIVNGGLCPTKKFLIKGDNPRVRELTKLVILAKGFGKTVFVRGVYCQPTTTGMAVVGEIYTD